MSVGTIPTPMKPIYRRTPVMDGAPKAELDRAERLLLAQESARQVIAKAVRDRGLVDEARMLDAMGLTDV